MTPETVSAAAKALVELRAASRVVGGLADGLEPETLADGYRVQDAFRGLWPHPVAGWKIGATAPAVQEKFGLDSPFAGPFFSPDVHASPARLEAAVFPHLCLESEFAFRFGHGLPPRETAYGRDEILDAIESLVPAIEIVGPRFDSLLFGRAPMAAADCGVNAGMVIGAPVTSWRETDLTAHPVILLVDGAVVAEGTGANVLGSPLVVLDWAVNHLSGRGIGIAAGQLISTGTTTGLIHVEHGQDAVADFGSFGRVAVTFTGEAHPQQVSPPV